MIKFSKISSLVSMKNDKRLSKKNDTIMQNRLTFERSMSLPHRNQSIDLLCKSIDWFLSERGIDR